MFEKIQVAISQVKREHRSSLEFRENITKEAHLCGDLGFDSLELQDLWLSIEDEFGIIITFEEWDDVNEGGTVQTIIDCVKEKRQMAVSKACEGV